MTASTAHIDQERRKRAPKKPKAPGKKGAPKVARFVGGPFAFYGLLAAVVVLLGLGTLMVVSASSGEAIINQVSKEAAKAAEAGKVAGLTSIKASVWEVGLKHLISIILGALIAWGLSCINYRDYRKFALPAGLALLALLIAVPIFGFESNGAKRWIIIAGQSIQPSEFAKPILFLIATFAFYRIRELGNSHTFDLDIWLIPFPLLLASVGLIFAQPETGNVLILMVGIAVAYLMLDLPMRNFWGAVGCLGAGVAIISIITPYRAQRILQFVGAGEKDADALWQVKQAQLAFGSGGFTGLGPGLSRQKYFYLPEAQNDFIIAIIGEELGFLGSATVLAAFALMLFCGFKIALKAKDSLGRALASGSLAMLIFQAILNVFSVTGLGPVTGKPLPFVTLGGSSMITSFILLGIILSVARFGGQKEGRVVGASNVRLRRASVKKEPAQAPRAAHVPRQTRSAKKSSHPRTPQPQQKEEFDEDSLEWRWDSGSHLSGPRRR